MTAGFKYRISVYTVGAATLTCVTVGNKWQNLSQRINAICRSGTSPGVVCTSYLKVSSTKIIWCCWVLFDCGVPAVLSVSDNDSINLARTHVVFLIVVLRPTDDFTEAHMRGRPNDIFIRQKIITPLNSKKMFVWLAQKRNLCFLWCIPSARVNLLLTLRDHWFGSTVNKLHKRPVAHQQASCPTKTTAARNYPGLEWMEFFYSPVIHQIPPFDNYSLR